MGCALVCSGVCVCVCERTRMELRALEFGIDVGVCVVLFLQWLVFGVIVDTVGNDPDTRKAVSLYLAASTSGVVGFRTARSYLFLWSENDPSDRPKTIVGMFADVVSLTQAFGMAFCCVRVWTLDVDHKFQTNSFLDNLGTSVFEMSMIQSGVGYVAEVPVNAGERIVAWMAAYVGGVLCVNLFFISLLLGRRGWWNFDPERVAFQKEAQSLPRLYM